MSKFCSKCGTELADDLMFCGNCGAKVGEAAPTAYAQAPASTMGKIDPMAIVKGTAEPKMNWIVALAAQVLAIILFFLPILSFNAPSYIKEAAGDEFPGPKGLFGMSSYLSGEAGLGTSVVFPIIGLIIVLAAVAFMALPLIQKTELNPIGALAVVVAQLIFFIGNIITVACYSSKVADSTGDFMKVGFNFGGWIYIIFSVVALYFAGMIVFRNKDSLLALIRK